MSNAGQGVIGLLKDGWAEEEIQIGLKRRPSLIRRVSLRLRSETSPKPRPPLHPNDKVAEVFAHLCAMVLQDINPEEATPDICKNFFREECNAYWRTGRDGFFKTKGLDMPGMRDGFPEDNVIFDRCIYWSNLFHHDAPQGIVRRKALKAPGFVEPGKRPLREKCVFQSRIPG
ncbi:hypothetical protein NHQ30_005757 [Ciborinia camelliae]|nr:hypothetical protein NHQ30_005757 [Ciborinia camelliae]